MSIQKKSLISTLKTAKKANVASSTHEVDAKGAKVSSMRLQHGKTVGHAKASQLRATSFKSAKLGSLRKV